MLEIGRFIGFRRFRTVHLGMGGLFRTPVHHPCRFKGCVVPGLGNPVWIGLPPPPCGVPKPTDGRLTSELAASSSDLISEWKFQNVGSQLVRARQSLEPLRPQRKIFGIVTLTNFSFMQ